jgi:hypothetical protein
MGIKNLNKFFMSFCSKKSMQKTHLMDLKEKKVIIDTSIYMYKFEGEKKLYENFNKMLKGFRVYNIEPLFVFDGKAPKEKKELIKKRAEIKKEAKDEYEKINELLEKEMNEEEKNKMKERLLILEKQMTKISKENIKKIKELIEAYGFSFCDAPGEADEFCAYMLLKNKNLFCFTEDMDMFVYGCNRIIKKYNVEKCNGFLYNLHQIRKELGISQEELKEICIITGTDYDVKEENDIFEVWKNFKEYMFENENMKFYQWLNKNKNYKIEEETFEKINKMFEIEKNEEKIKMFEEMEKNIKFTNEPFSQSAVTLVLNDLLRS